MTVTQKNGTNMNQQSAQIARTILEQLGTNANKMRIMLGSKHVSYDVDGSLSFNFKMCKKYNFCKIKLDANDTYQIKFFKFSKLGESKNIKVLDDVYNFQLKEIFEKETGLFVNI